MPNCKPYIHKSANLYTKLVFGALYALDTSSKSSEIAFSENTIIQLKFLLAF